MTTKIASLKNTFAAHPTKEDTIIITLQGTGLDLAKMEHRLFLYEAVKKLSVVFFMHVHKGQFDDMYPICKPLKTDDDEK